MPSVEQDLKWKSSDFRECGENNLEDIERQSSDRVPWSGKFKKIKNLRSLLRDGLRYRKVVGKVKVKARILLRIECSNIRMDPFETGHRRKNGYRWNGHKFAI